MVNYSKLFTFAFLWMFSLAASSCRSIRALSTDPATSEAILQASTGNSALVVLMGGDTVNCFSVSIRPDSTTWQVAEFRKEVVVIGNLTFDHMRWQRAEPGKQVTVPTDSVAAIRVGSPKTVIGVLIGAPLGFLLGGLIGQACSTIGGLFAAMEGGAGLGLLVGGLGGGVIGANNQTVYARDKTEGDKTEGGWQWHGKPNPQTKDSTGRPKTRDTAKEHAIRVR